MKKYLCILFIAIMTINMASAQDAKDETTVTPKHTSKQERFIMDFGFDSWTKVPTGIKTDWLKSRRFEFYFMKDRAFAAGHMAIAYGLGMSFTNVNSNGSFAIANGNTHLLQIPDTLLPSQNKLSTNFLEIPLELRFRTSPLHHGNRLKLAVGAKAGYLFQDHTKIEDGALKEKFYNTPNLNNFRFAYTARIGYGKWSLMGYYGINSLIKKGKGDDQIIPFGVGIAFTPTFSGVSE